MAEEGARGMPALVIGYNVEWVKDRTATEAFLARVRRLHERLGAPCTLFLLGEVIRNHHDELRRLAGNPLFDLQMTLGRPLKTVCQVAEGQTTLWRGATLEEIDEEVGETKRLFSEELEVQAVGISDPLGYYRGLADRPDILDVLDRHGLRFCRTYARNQHDWQPVDFSVEPFAYALQGFPHIIEFPAQGWQDAIIRTIYGWDDREGYVEYLKGDVDEVARREELIWSYWAQDWSVVRGDPSLEIIERLIAYAGETGVELMSQRQADEEFRRRPTEKKATVRRASARRSPRE